MIFFEGPKEPGGSLFGELAGHFATLLRTTDLGERALLQWGQGHTRSRDAGVDGLRSVFEMQMIIHDSVAMDISNVSNCTNIQMYVVFNGNYKNITLGTRLND